MPDSPVIDPAGTPRGFVLGSARPDLVAPEADPLGAHGLVRIGALAGLLAVVLTVLKLTLSADRPAAVEVILSALPTLLLVLWWIGISNVQRVWLGGTGKAGAWAAIAGCAVIGSLDALQVVVAAIGPASWKGYFETGAVTGVAGVAVGLILWGVLALGTDSLRVGVLPRGSVVLWMAGLASGLVTSWTPVGLATLAGVVWSSASLLRSGAGSASAMSVTSQASPRLAPLDALRGTIMGLMAIDHASLFVRRWHPFETWDQALPSYPTLGAMLTRLATHPCAPGFFFLMGAGMALFLKSRRHAGWSDGKIAGHLALRGLLFVALEQLIVDVATAGGIYPLDFSILAGLGAAMLLAIPFLFLSGVAQALVGAAILLLMQFVPGWLLHAELGFLAPARLLLLPGSVGVVHVLYSPVPWLGVSLLGMAFARGVQSNADRAFRLALLGGVGCLAFFPLLRAAGGFGNLRMPAGQTLIDFFNVVKYPPSLTFLLLSLGFDLVLLGLFARLGRWLSTWARPLVTLGQAALYFFLAHWYVYVFLGWVFSAHRDLLGTYLAWAVGLVALYPICRAYAAFKHWMPPGSVWRMI